MVRKVALEDHTGTSPKVLANQTLRVVRTTNNAGWTKLSFELTPTASTNCEGIANAEAWSTYKVSCPINNTCEPARSLAALQVICLPAFSQVSLTVMFKPRRLWRHSSRGLSLG